MRLLTFYFILILALTLVAFSPQAAGNRFVAAPPQQTAQDAPAQVHQEIVWKTGPRRPFHKIDIPMRQPIIHPIQMFSLILLAVLAAMTWASEEWDWDRFIKAEKFL